MKNLILITSYAPDDKRQQILRLDRTVKNRWSIHDIGKTENLSSIKIIVDDEVRRKYNFNFLPIKDFKKYNYILWN